MLFRRAFLLSFRSTMYHGTYGMFVRSNISLFGLEYGSRRKRDHVLMDNTAIQHVSEGKLAEGEIPGTNVLRPLTFH